MVFAAFKVFTDIGWQLYYVPSSSMRPALQEGNLILVQKHSYNLFFPFFNHPILSTGIPAYGDVVVFNHQQKNQVKRILGLPGDEIRLVANTLHINGQPLAQDTLMKQTRWHYISNEKWQQIQSESNITINAKQDSTKPRFVADGIEVPVAMMLVEERAADFSHQIWLNQDATLATNQTWRVPQDHYFVLGDNRHESTDSRHFGFISHKSLKGKLLWVINQT